jgi:hypothetical protein
MSIALQEVTRQLKQHDLENRTTQKLDHAMPETYATNLERSESLDAEFLKRCVDYYTRKAVSTSYRRTSHVACQ